MFTGATRLFRSIGPPTLTIPPDHFRSQLTAAAYAYWRARAGKRCCPSRSDLAPEDMTFFLSHVILVDVLAVPMDFRYRLVGTAVDYHMSRSFTGLRMSELEQQRSPSKIWSSCESVARNFEPLRGVVPYIGPNKQFIESEDIIMPLSSDQRRVDMLFVVVDFIRKERTSYLRARGNDAVQADRIWRPKI